MSGFFSKLYILLLLLFFANCTIQYADRQFLNFDANSKYERVSHTVMGSFMFMRIPFAPQPTLRQALYELKKINSCQDLKNVDIQYYENLYFFFGFPKIVVKADCVK